MANSAAMSARAAPSRTIVASPRRAERQPERIEQDRFAGAGLPGERGKAGAELDFGRVDDDEVLEASSQICSTEGSQPTP